VTGFLPDVKAPTLVLHRGRARGAPIAAGRAAAALIPDARFVALEGDIGHPLCGDISYVETMTRFLDEGRVAKPDAAALETRDVHTILITDMEGCITVTERLGDRRWLELLHAHNAILRDQLAANEGFEVR
jgi:hypothetical protein